MVFYTNKTLYDMPMISITLLLFKTMNQNEKINYIMKFSSIIYSHRHIQIIHTDVCKFKDTKIE